MYAGDKFFGIIRGQKLFFRTTEKTCPDYTAAGMTIFRPNAKQFLKNYYEVPPNVLENRKALVTWARRAIRSQK